jgi:hypothetical protein
MKAFGKGMFPGHIDPIQRDLLIVLAAGMLSATALISVGFVVFH